MHAISPKSHTGQMQKGIWSQSSKIIYPNSEIFMVVLKPQALASLVASSGEVLEERLDRVRTYYDLLTIPFEVSVSSLNCARPSLAAITWCTSDRHGYSSVL